MTGAFAPNLSERYLYLPTAAAAAAIGLSLASLSPDRHASGRPSQRPLLIGTFVALGFAATAASVVRAREWGDPLSLFAGSVVADPANPEPWQILGTEQHRQGDRAAALRSFERSVELGSTRAGLYSNLYAVRREAGDLARAAEACERAIRLDPEDPRPGTTARCAVPAGAWPRGAGGASGTHRHPSRLPARPRAPGSTRGCPCGTAAPAAAAPALECSP